MQNYRDVLVSFLVILESAKDLGVYQLNTIFFLCQTTTAGIYPDRKCTDKFGGTSASTAFLSGILALVLQAK